MLRFIQGIGVGGEWGGSVLLAMEWARTNHSRGFIASWPQFGVPAGLFLANLAVLAFSRMSGEQFLAWGWRVPFLLAIVLVGVGLWIRLGILETPVFAKLVAENGRAGADARGDQAPAEGDPAVGPRPHGRAGALLHLHGVRLRLRIGTLNVSRDFLLTAVLAASLVSFVTIPFFGHLSDRIGRKRCT